jgi:dUTP pyrophosphatase
MSEFQKPVYLLNIKLSEKNLELYNYYNTFTNHHNGDSGIDLFNTSEIVVDPFKVGNVNFNIMCEMINIETNSLTSYYLVPRSSISNTFFQMANSVGIIDAGYRGEIKAKIRNFNPESSEILPVGKFFQIVSPDLKPIKVVIVQELSLTTRDSGGFGSTNKN